MSNYFEVIETSVRQSDTTSTFVKTTIEDLLLMLQSASWGWGQGGERLNQHLRVGLKGHNDLDIYFQSQ